MSCTAAVCFMLLSLTSHKSMMSWLFFVRARILRSVLLFLVEMLSERQFCEAIEREGNLFFLVGTPFTISSFKTSDESNRARGVRSTIHYNIYDLARLRVSALTPLRDDSADRDWERFINPGPLPFAVLLVEGGEAKPLGFGPNHDEFTRKPL